MSDQSRPFQVAITGGDNDNDRLMMVTAVTALLKKEGFTNVQGYMHTDNSSHAAEIEPTRMMKSTVADIVQQSRPDLFKARINVTTVRREFEDNSPFIYSAKEGPNKSVHDTRGDPQLFLQQVENLEIDSNYGAITVKANSPKRLGDAVQALFREDIDMPVLVELTNEEITPGVVVGKF